MSASATPSALMAAMMSVIAFAPASRTALTVGLLIVTPRLIRATSGTIVTLPLPDTVMVCWAGSFGGGGAGDRARTEGEDRDGHDEGTERTGAERPERAGHVDHLRMLPPGMEAVVAPETQVTRAVPPQSRRVMQTVNATVPSPAMTWNS